MMNTPNQSEICTLLAEYEDTIASLYHLFSRLFPREGHFWTKLALEEHDHAESLLRVCSLIEDGIPVEIGKSLRPELIHDALAVLRQQLGSCSESPPTLEDALLMASGIEGSILENRVYTSGRESNVLVQSTFMSIHRDTNRHFSEVQALYNKTRDRTSFDQA